MSSNCVPGTIFINLYLSAHILSSLKSQPEESTITPHCNPNFTDEQTET